MDMFLWGQRGGRPDPDGDVCCCNGLSRSAAAPSDREGPGCHEVRESSRRHSVAEICVALAA